MQILQVEILTNVGFFLFHVPKASVHLCIERFDSGRDQAAKTEMIPFVLGKCSALDPSRCDENAHTAKRCVREGGG